MPRSKPYTKKLAVLDLILVILTGPVWIAIMLVRELYRRS